MIKLICLSCGKVWYTANTKSGQYCDDCGGNLVREEIYVQKIKNKLDDEFLHRQEEKIS